MKYPKIAVVASMSYLGIFLIMWIVHVYLVTSGLDGGYAIGFPAIIFTQPSSFLTVFIMNMLGYIEWCNSLFASSPMFYAFFSMLGLLPAALINAAVLFFILNRFGKKRKALK